MGLPQKFAQLIEGGLVLIGQAGDEAGAQHHAGDLRPQRFHHGQQPRVGLPAAHGLQNRVVAVLNGHVDVLADLRLRRDGVDQLVGDGVGIKVVQADPVEIQLAQLTQQLRQLLLAIEVHAVAGDILRDDDALFHAVRRQGTSFGQNVLHGAAAVAAPQLGDDAVGTAVGAALGNAQIGDVGGGRQHAGQLLHRAVDVTEVGAVLAGHHLLHGGHNVAIVGGAHHAVDLRQFRPHFVPVALAQTAGHQNFLHLARRFQLGGGEDRLNGLRLGAVDKAAGVDDHHVAAVDVLLHGHACLQAHGHHLLRVDAVFVAAKGDKGYVHKSPRFYSSISSPRRFRAGRMSLHEKPRRSRASLSFFSRARSGVLPLSFFCRKRSMAPALSGS